MTTLREAAQQALEAMRCAVPTGKITLADWYKSIAALRAALAEPVQEPVAWMVYTEGGTSAYVTDNPNDLVGAYRALPLYTAPPQRRPLTEEEIDGLVIQHAGYGQDNFYAVTRAIERAHGIT